LTGFIRKAIGVDNVVDRGSLSYTVGEYTEVTIEVVATLGSGALKVAAKKTGSGVARKQAARMTRSLVSSGRIYIISIRSSDIQVVPKHFSKWVVFPVGSIVDAGI